MSEGAIARYRASLEREISWAEERARNARRDALEAGVAAATAGGLKLALKWLDEELAAPASPAAPTDTATPTKHLLCRRGFAHATPEAVVKCDADTAALPSDMRERVQEALSLAEDALDDLVSPSAIKGDAVLYDDVERKGIEARNKAREALALLGRKP